MARTVTGEQLVQGTDYAYTLQGWLKGVNATGIHNSNYDMGNDGLPGNSNQYTGKDALGFAVNYFTGEYIPINPTVAPFPNAVGNLAGEYRPLYNGNISSMVVNLKYPSATAAQVPQLYNYRYDQLNRITGMDAYRGYDTSANSWASAVVTTDYKERVTYDANGNIMKYLRNGVSSVNTHMDSLSYNYFAGTNRLKFVRDSVPDNIYTPGTADVEDINNQPLGPLVPSNYTYTEIGNLKTDAKDSIKLIKWNVYGKITEIQRSASNARPVNLIRYTYDAAGNRISKLVDRITDNLYDYTFYVRDAQGNVMATYMGSGNASNNPLGPNYSLQLTEQHIYGSSRAGLVNRNVNMKTAFTNPPITIFERGNKNYELSNHLGNVLVTVSDKKIPHSTNGTTIDWYNADVITAQDYYAGGMIMPGRKYSSGSQYRYSFNGQEKDNELNENITTAQFWEYDSRIGKRWNIDPVPKVEESPYLCFSGNPIFISDHNGDDGDPPWWKRLLNSLFGGDAENVSSGMDNIREGVRNQAIGPWDNHIFNEENPGSTIAYRQTQGYIQGLTGVVQISEGVQSFGAKVEGIVEAPMLIKSGIDLIKTGAANRTLLKPLVTEEVQEVQRIKNYLAEPIPVTNPKGVNNPKVKEALDYGNKMHNELTAKAKAKGWTTGKQLTDPKTGKTVIPDVITPSGHPLEYKPNTPSGIKKGKTQLKGQERATGTNGRVIYYEPKKKT